MRKRFKVGDAISICGIRQYGLCTNNSFGGTESVKNGEYVGVKIVAEWFDYEIGQRYIGERKDGKKYYFGDDDIDVRYIANVDIDKVFVKDSKNTAV